MNHVIILLHRHILYQMKVNFVGFHLNSLTYKKNKLFWNTTFHCRQLKNVGFDVKNDVISGVLFHL